MLYLIRIRGKGEYFSGGFVTAEKPPYYVGIRLFRHPTPPEDGTRGEPHPTKRGCSLLIDEFKRMTDALEAAIFASNSIREKFISNTFLSLKLNLLQLPLIGNDTKREITAVVDHYCEDDIIQSLLEQEASLYEIDEALDQRLTSSTFVKNLPILLTEPFDDFVCSWKDAIISLLLAKELRKHATAIAKSEREKPKLLKRRKIAKLALNSQTPPFGSLDSESPTSPEGSPAAGGSKDRVLTSLRPATFYGGGENNGASGMDLSKYFQNL